MREKRKLSLMTSFPEIPSSRLKILEGKGALNVCFFVSNGKELFARCYHRYSDGIVVERQRYVFAKDGYCRYRSDFGTKWKICKEFREPVFCLPTYGYVFGNSYIANGLQDAIKNSDLKYSLAENYHGKCIFEYLRAYCKHRNLEYLMKAGYESEAFEEVPDGFYGTHYTIRCSHLINWKSNNLLMMLQLSKTEFKIMQGNEYLYTEYRRWRDIYPKLHPENILAIAKVFRHEEGTLNIFISKTGLKPQRIARYISEQNVNRRDYLDYLGQCKHFNYNLHDTAFSMPHDFHAAHDKLSKMIVYEKNEQIDAEFKSRYESRKSLEYAVDNYIIRQPVSVAEIIDEGTALSHCVGGYAERHANGKLTIMFLRLASEPDKPMYTIEVSNELKIIQCRGYKNDRDNPKPDYILAVEDAYRDYLSTLKSRKECKTA